MTALGTPPTAGGPGFVPTDLAGATTTTSGKSGYYFVVTGAGVDVLAQASTCNGVETSKTEFFASGLPQTAGSTGTRYFATDQSGMLRQHSAAMTAITEGAPLQ
jgi:hypothetical protein